MSLSVQFFIFLF